MGWRCRRSSRPRSGPSKTEPSRKYQRGEAVRPFKVLIRREPDCRDLPLPAYATAGAAGMDLYAAVPGETVLAPGERRLIPTGIRVGLPEGYEAQVRPRSGLAARHGIGMVNSPGTI